MKTHTINLPEPLSFEWDQWNENKILSKHGITSRQCEEVFKSESSFIEKDVFHSSIEERYVLIGKTNSQVNMYTVFTVRNNLVRIISARYMHQKEIEMYEKKAGST